MKTDEVRDRLFRLREEPHIRVREFDGMDDMFDELAQAAVLIPLTERDGELDVVFTERSSKLRKHAGQISFPGGRMDDTDDDLTFTALRESHEEIALHPNDVDVYGSLMSMPTVTGYDVTVFVGEFPHPYALQKNPDEIETIIQAPLSLFLEGSIHRVEEREWNGIRFPMHYFDYDGHNIWGATAYMMHTFIKYLRGEHR